MSSYRHIKSGRIPDNVKYIGPRRRGHGLEYRHKPGGYSIRVTTEMRRHGFWFTIDGNKIIVKMKN